MQHTDKVIPVRPEPAPYTLKMWKQNHALWNAVHKAQTDANNLRRENEELLS